LALPIVSPETWDLLLQVAGNGAEITIDLNGRRLTAGDVSAPFEMDNATQTALIRGRDDTLDSLEHAGAIRDYEAELKNEMRVSVIK